MRSARAGDLPAVLEILAERKLAPNGVERQFGSRFVVAEAASEVIAVAGVEVYGGDGLFRSAAVRIPWEGRGVGAAVTRNRLDWAREQGLRALYLLTETAAAYWPRFGFVVIPRDAAPAAIAASPEWAGGCPSSAVAMRLALETGAHDDESPGGRSRERPAP